MGVVILVLTHLHFTRKDIIFKLKNMNPFFLFKVYDNKIVYDRYSNEFLIVDDKTVDSLKNNVIDDYNLKNLRSKYHILRNFAFPGFSLSKTESISEKIRNKVSQDIVQLCFIVTEDCNLRCKYCVYSGLYDNRRGHNSLHRMDINMARKVIDQFVNNNYSIKTISFYGGESLMEFGIIQDIVNYAKQKDNSIQFAMNTNLTLLTPKILSFLITNKITLTISLDGPSKVHDLYRISKNQKPTHHIVENNLNKIREVDEQYFLHHIIFNIVIVPHPFPIETLDDYFSSELFKDVPLESFIVLTLNTDKNEFVTKYSYHAFYDNFFTYSRKLFVDKHIQGCTDFSRIKISYNFHIKKIQRIFYREMDRLDEYSFFWPNAICILGLRSIFINSSGVFYPCENLYDTNQLAIGSVEGGIKTEEIIKITNEYISHANSLCKNCWALRFCSHCFTSSFVDNKYSLKYKYEECNSMKGHIKEMFNLFFEIYIKNPKAFDYLSPDAPYEKYEHMIKD